MSVAPFVLGSGPQREPPIKATVTGAGSSLVIERRAWVGWPLTSLTPKTSACGNEVETLTARLGEVFVSTSGAATGDCTL